jgi:hypothetical protein
MEHKIFLLVTLVFFSGCMKVKKKADEAQAAQAAEVHQVETLTVTKDQSFDYDYVVEEGRPFQQVKFRFPSKWPNDILVRKNHFSKPDAFVDSALQIKNEKTWVDALTSEEKIRYQFYELVGKDLKLLEEVEVLPVLDLALTEDLNLADKYSLTAKTKKIVISHLSIASGKHLFLNDYSGIIEINNLNSSNGVIQTFPDNAKASFNVTGRSGGLLRLKIMSGEGTLSINMFGEAGGDGANGAAPDASLMGAKGTQGTASKYNLSVVIGQLGSTYYCETQPGPGNKGGQGKRGFSGLNGAKGGNSGQAIIEVTNESTLLISSFNQAGLKGFGGAGGRGGAGGPGGDSGSINSNGLVSIPCVLAGVGEVGVSGEQGDPGHEGQDGLVSKNQLFNNGAKTSFNNED